MKKLFAILLVAALLLSALPFAVSAADTPYANTLPTVKTSLELLAEYLNGASGSADDLNGDGVFSLLDVLYMLKLVIKASDMPASGAKLFDASGLGSNFYNYCPSVMQMEDGTRYIYYCTNRVSSNVTDYIGCRKGTLNADGTYTWGSQSFALSPSSDLWDSRHACDPSVIAGEFVYGGETYNYLMAYLGCSRSDSQDNEVGIAVSKTPEGPYTRVGTQPLVAFAFDETNENFQWGAGQPSLVSIDKAGKAWLFYTIGDPTATRTVVSECDFSNLDAPVVGEPVKVRTTGLKNLNGGNDILNNADFAYDAAKNRFYCASDCHPNPSDSPDFISSHFRASYFDGTSFTKATWTNIANIGEVDTGYPRNHNVGLVRDLYGHTVSEDYLTVYYTVSKADSDFWTYHKTYRIHEFNLLLWK